MRVLITGSAGFVGSHTVSAFLARGDEVQQADRKTGQDLTQLEVARAVMRPRPDVVIHLASSCSTPGSLANPVETFNDTVSVAVNVLEAARADRVPVIVTSSVKARDGWTPYGAAKQMVEIWASEYRSAFHVPVVINRPGTIYGPGQEGSPESGWIAWFCKARAESVPVVINGDGSQVRDLLHVTDYVRLLEMQAEQPERFMERIHDVGGGVRNAVSVLQMADHLELTYSFGPPRYGDAQSYVAHNDVEGWEPEVGWWESETLGVKHG